MSTPARTFSRTDSAAHISALVGFHVPGGATVLNFSPTVPPHPPYALLLAAGWKMEDAT